MEMLANKTFYEDPELPLGFYPDGDFANFALQSSTNANFALSNDVSAAFHDYCRPLVGDLPKMERL